MKLQTLKPKVQTLAARTMATVNPNSWREGKTSTQRGYGSRWQKAREAYLSKHPLCVMCEAEGRVCPASVVDHINPHKGDMVLFWKSENWQSLCRSCHSSTKQREEAALYK